MSSKLCEFIFLKTNNKKTLPTICADIIPPRPRCHPNVRWATNEESTMSRISMLDMTLVCLRCFHSPEYSVLFSKCAASIISIVKSVSHAGKTDFSHEKTCCIMDPWMITGGVAGSEPTNLVFYRYFERQTRVFLSIQQRMGGVGDLGGEPSAALVEGRLRESFELSMWNCPNLFINIYRNVLFVNFYQKTKCFKSAARDFGGDKTVTGHCKNVFCVRYCISSISLEMCQKIAH